MMIVEESPSNRTSCYCGMKLLKGTIRLKIQDGEYDGRPRWTYFCPDCGMEELENKINIIHQTQDELVKKQQQFINTQ